MLWQSSFYVFLMLVAGFVSAIAAYLTWQRRPAPGSAPLVVVNLAGAAWAWLTALELTAGTLSAAVLFHKLTFLPIEVIGPALFVFAAEYTGRDRWVTTRKRALLAVVPIISLALVWTTPLQSLFWRALEMNASGSYMYLHKTPGVWWWIDSAYTYGLIAAAVALIGAMFIREPGLYRRQAAAILAAILVPVVVDSVYIFDVVDSGGVDLAPALFGWVALMLYWGFARFQLLDVTPTAREFVIKHLADSLLVTDTSGRVVYLNAAAEDLLEARLRSVVGKPMAEVLAGSPGLLAAYENERAGEDGAPQGSLQEWEHAGRFYHGRVSPLLDSRARVRGSILVLRDITDRKKAELALEEARQDLERRVDERTAELATEKDLLAQLNTVAVELARCITAREVSITGVRLACEAIGCSTAALWVNTRGGRRRLAASRGLSRTVRQHLRRHLAVSETGDWKDVSDWPESLADRIACLPVVSRRHTLGVICLISEDGGFWMDEERLSLARGVTSQIALALENARRYDDAQFLAERDSLTRLLNHRGLSRRMEQQVALCEEAGSVFSVVMMDVDSFKLFNDTHGHVAGDRVLQIAARVLTGSLRRVDVTARVGGDEFLAVLPDCDAETARGLMERVRVALECESLQVDDQAIPIKMSYGVATYPEDGTGVSELLAAADSNLYRSKRRGGNCITVSGSDDSRHPTPIGSFTVLDGLVTTVDTKDHYTRQHSDEVTEYAVALAAKLGLSQETQRSLRIAGLLHDVGKVGVPDHILRKPARLNEDEVVVVRQHVTLGELIVKGVPNQQEVVQAISSHHERFDGNGYPRGLKGKEIPLLGRILAVTDAYSAMMSHRPYRRAMSRSKAIAELASVAGTQLDPDLVEAFLELLEQGDLGDQGRELVAVS
jgi:diguanylate cyclase (GGDEF)-like protein/putative nucleotidyltransferase with HDIG domain/PAS domain S-box-containing protein